MSDGHPQKEPFFLVLPVDNSDGTISLPDADGSSSNARIEGAVAQATSESEDHGGVYYVYECKPVKRIKAYRVKVEDV